MRVKMIVAEFLIVVCSFTNPRTIYISNRTDESVTLLFEKDSWAGTISKPVAFGDDLRVLSPNFVEVFF